MLRRGGAFLAALAAVLLPGLARGQSGADLSGRLRIDGLTSDFTAVEAVFRNADNCTLLMPPDSCRGVDEEPAGDSSWSALQDVRQIHVTWDAKRLYVAADATLGGHALLLLLDFRPGGLASMVDLLHWRRALEFGPELRPDAFLAVRDAETVPELWLVEGSESLRRVSPDDYEAVASFDADAPGRALEAAIPWKVLFPAAPFGIDPEPGAAAESMFVLPEASSRNGLRLAAVVVHAADGLSGPDVAPNNSAGMPFAATTPAILDRVARLAWDERGGGPPHFVDFGAAVQTQSAPRFLPAPPRPPAAEVRLADLRTFASGRPSRLLLGDPPLDLQFAFTVVPPAPLRLFVSASVVSLRGERVRDLYRDEPRTPGVPAAPLGVYGDATRDRWDGRDAAGRPVAGGIYVLRLSAGPSPGTTIAALQRAITVVR